VAGIGAVVLPVLTKSGTLRPSPPSSTTQHMSETTDACLLKKNSSRARRFFFVRHSHHVSVQMPASTLCPQLIPFISSPEQSAAIPWP